MSKCQGCGVNLVYDDVNNIGYTPSYDNILCQRCFNIKNYNKCSKQNINISDETILNEINKMKYYTIFLVDIFSLNDNTVKLYKQIKNEKMMIITKCDMFPLNIKKEQIIDNIKRIYDINDVIISSVVTKEGYREITKIIKNKKNVIFSGPTSSGKSSLINGLIASDITVSHRKNTTLDFIKLNVEGCVIYDSPGFNSNYSEIKQKGAVRPKTIILKKNYILEINNHKLYFDNDVNLTLFLNTNILYKTKKKTENFKTEINITKKSDIVISNLGFIYLKKGKCFINNLDEVFVRNSIVGGK